MDRKQSTDKVSSKEVLDSFNLFYEELPSKDNESSNTPRLRRRSK